jgi:hypothetical protein
MPESISETASPHALVAQSSFVGYYAGLKLESILGRGMVRNLFVLLAPAMVDGHQQLFGWVCLADKCVGSVSQGLSTRFGSTAQHNHKKAGTGLA